MRRGAPQAHSREKTLMVMKHTLKRYMVQCTLVLGRAHEIMAQEKLLVVTSVKLYLITLRTLLCLKYTVQVYKCSVDKGKTHSGIYMKMNQNLSFASIQRII